MKKDKSDTIVVEQLRVLESFLIDQQRTRFKKMNYDQRVEFMGIMESYKMNKLLDMCYEVLCEEDPF